MAALSDVCDFLRQGRLAVVGVSRNPNDFTRGLFREFVNRGYDVVPVHPGVAEIEGRPCFSHVQEISPPVEGALLLTSPTVTSAVVRDCAEAGVNHVWMYRAAGAGSISSEALALCESQGIGGVAGECPYMFFPSAGFPHTWHACARKILGRYPR